MAQQLKLPLEPLDLPKQTHVRADSHVQFNPSDFYTAVKNHDWDAFEQWLPIVQSRKYALNYFTSAFNAACECNHTDMIAFLAPLADCNARHGQPLLHCIRHNNIEALTIVLPRTYFPKFQSKALSTAVLPQFTGPALDYLLPYCTPEHDDGMALYAAISHENMEMAQKLYPVSNVAKVWARIHSPNFGPAEEYRNVYIEDLQVLERHYLEQQLPSTNARNARKI